MVTRALQAVGQMKGEERSNQRAFWTEQFKLGREEFEITAVRGWAPGPIFGVLARMPRLNHWALSPCFIAKSVEGATRLLQLDRIQLELACLPICMKPWDRPSPLQPVLGFGALCISLSRSGWPRRPRLESRCVISPPLSPRHLRLVTDSNQWGETNFGQCPSSKASTRARLSHSDSQSAG